MIYILTGNHDYPSTNLDYIYTFFGRTGMNKVIHSISLSLQIPCDLQPPTRKETGVSRLKVTKGTTTISINVSYIYDRYSHLLRTYIPTTYSLVPSITVGNSNVHAYIYILPNLTACLFSTTSYPNSTYP